MTSDHMPYMVIEGRLGWLKPYRVLHWTEPKRALHARVLGFPLACHAQIYRTRINAQQMCQL